MCVRFDPAHQFIIDAYRLEGFKGQYSVACYAVQHPVRQQHWKVFSLQLRRSGLARP